MSIKTINVIICDQCEKEWYYSASNVFVMARGLWKGSVCIIEKGKEYLHFCNKDCMNRFISKCIISVIADAE